MEANVPEHGANRAHLPKDSAVIPEAPAKDQDDCDTTARQRELIGFLLFMYGEACLTLHPRLQNQELAPKAAMRPRVLGRRFSGRTPLPQSNPDRFDS